MKVQEFVKMYKENNRMDLKKVLNVKEYVGLAYKEQMAQLVVENSTIVDNGKVYVNSLERYLLFTIASISLHTNLEFIDDEDFAAIDAYDMLCENHLLDKVIATFQEDHNACQIILDMVTTDRMQSSMTLEQTLYRFLENLSKNLGVSMQDLVQNVKSGMNELGANQEAVSKLLELFPKE